MKKKRNTRGVTLAEALMVIGIIAVLAGVAFIAVFRYQRSMHQLEMDGIAKEIFVAAQNHLTMADGQGYLNRSSSAFGTEEDKDAGIYYFTVGGTGNGWTDPTDRNTVLSLMLPYASVDETVRLGGSYIVRYQKSPAQVLDVFYADKNSSRYGYTFTGAKAEYEDLINNYRGGDEETKSARRNYGADKSVIGYFGGVEAEKLITITLETPTLVIHNGDTLWVEITNPNYTNPNAQLKLVVEGNLSGAKKTVLLDADKQKVDFTMDDVTTDGAHFADLFEGFIPGETITVKAIAYSNAVFANVAETAPQTTNSLFATGSSESEALIGSIRHLQNLDKDVSGLDNTRLSITAAKQTDDLSWPQFVNNTSAGANGILTVVSNTVSSDPGTYRPVVPNYTLNYDGRGHSISDVVIDWAGDAGLFGALNNNSVTDLELLNFNVTSTSGNAGALAGTVNGANGSAISGVLARNDAGDASLQITGTGNVGGLAGLMSKGQIYCSGAAVYVHSSGSGGSAGGLVGNAGQGLTIRDCYAGGHTENGRYLDTDTAGAAARYNVNGATAGGLVGTANGAVLQYCYSTASATGDTAGGLVGRVTGGTLMDTYSTGRVKGLVGGAFAGVVTGTPTCSNNQYFQIINEDLAPFGSGTAAALPAAFDSTLDAYHAFVGAPGVSTDAAPYDGWLVFEFKGKTDMPGLVRWHTAADTSEWPSYMLIHYGDWPSPETKVINPDSLRITTVTTGNSHSAALAAGVSHARLSFGAEANIPATASFSAVSLSSGDAGYEGYINTVADMYGTEPAAVSGTHFLDLSILSDGQEMQPQAPVTVELKLTDGSYDDNLQVIHFGKVPEEIPFTLEGDILTFETTGFSVYAVVNGTPPLRTYSFYSLNEQGQYSEYYFYTYDGLWVNKQTLKNGDPLIVPQLPASLNGEVTTFAGWYEYDEGSDTYAAEPFDFNNIPQITRTETVILRARFADYAYVIFHEQYNGATNTWPITATRRGAIKGGTTSVTVSDVTVTYDDSAQSGSGSEGGEGGENQENAAPEMAFRGWSRTPVDAGAVTDQNGDPIQLVASPLTITGNVDLYPVFVHINWLTYSSAPVGEGATYFAPTFYYTDEGAVTLPVPRMTGYTFLGWYTAEEGGKRISNADGSLRSGSGLTFEADHLQISGGQLMLDEDVTIYGHWEQAQADYYVVIWRQSVNDSKNASDADKTYDFAESVKLQALTGATVTVGSVHKGYGGSGAYEGFHYSRCDASATVAGNGSTVLNVYYDRDLMTIVFSAGTNNVPGKGTAYVYTATTDTSGTQYGFVNGEYVQLTRGVGTQEYAYTTQYTYTNANGDNDNNPGKYGVIDGEFARVYWINSSFRTANNYSAAVYSGTVYSRDNTGSPYTGVRYTRIGTRAPYTYTPTEANTGTQYGMIDDGHVQLTRSETTTYTWTYNNGQNTYTGTRYTRSSQNNVLVWTGLYRQTFAQNGYNWDTVSSFRWNESGGTGQTLLDGFTRLENPYTLTCQGNNGNNHIYHYREQLDGTYTEDDRGDARTTSTSITFYFTNKFDGYTVSYYSTSSEGFRASGGTHEANDGGSVSNQSLPLHVYHKRTPYVLTFVDSYNNAELYRNDAVPYKEPLGADNVNAASRYYTETPVSSRSGYVFTGWYADNACTRQVFFTQAQYDASTLPADKKVLYASMPANNLQIYAGWETEWYLIEIDPNGGQLAAGDSTWFWESFGGDPIIEYTRTSRDYIESLNGTYYYHLYDREHYGLTDEWDSAEGGMSLRDAYYTEDLGDATDLEHRYERSDGAFRYAGWFKVNADGTESLYNFGTAVTENTVLRLHWKQMGTYFIRYNAGEGRLDDQDNNEDTFKILDSSDYADHSDVVVTRTAHAPTGENFVGWHIRNDPSGTLYYPGQNFEFQSKFAVTEIDENGKEKKHLIMDAVYSIVGAAQIVYDANGGTVDSGVDYGDRTDESAPLAVKTRTETSATIAHLVNNSEVRLSSGTGFANGELVFNGWNTKNDATGQHFDADGLYYVDANEPITLYAEWRVRVFFDKNKDDATWGGAWDPAVYTWDDEKEQYYITTFVNRTVEEPPYVPVSADHLKRFVYWSPERYTDSSDVAYPFDFTQPITRDVSLYGFWDTAIEVPYHVLDSTDETIVEKTGWRLDPGHFLVSTGTVIPLAQFSDTVPYTDVPSGHSFAFACVSDSIANVSESDIITQVGYNIVTKRVNVTYAGGATEDLPSGLEIYLIYYTDPETLPIGYKRMDRDGNLTTVAVNAAAPTGATFTRESVFDCAASISRPLAWANNTNFKYFAYAIGDPNASSDAQLHLVTPAASNDNSRPALRVRNTWRGFEYSLNNGADWIGCGYDIQLYAVYFESMPTVVTVRERTVGTAADKLEEFRYTVTVTETETVYSREDTYRRNGSSGNYTYTLSSSGTDTQVGDPVTRTVSSGTFDLVHGGTETTTLFYTESTASANGKDYGSGWYYYRNTTVTTTVITQTVTVTQTAKDEYTTVNDGAAGDHQYVYTYTTVSSTGETDQTVTYTNTRTQQEIQLHVAEALGNGFILRDSTLRAADAGIYTRMVVNNGTVTLAQDDPAGLFIGDPAVYTFAGIIYGRAAEDGSVIRMGETEVSSVTFGELANGDYALYLNGDTNLLLEEYQIFFVYYQMPKVYYVKEGANGSLALIATPTRNGAAVELNGVTVAQGITLAVGNAPLHISQIASDGWRVPPDLDGERTLSLDYVMLGAGPVGSFNISGLDTVSTEKTLSLAVVDGQVKFKINDMAAWIGFSGQPAIFVIYKEKGYDLTLTKTVDGTDEDRAQTFRVRISSLAITESIYSVTNYTFDTVTAVPASGSTPGHIDLLGVTHGSEITIHALQRGGYTVAELELDHEQFEMSVKVDGYAVTVAGDAATMTLDANKTVAITNAVSTKDITFRKVNGFGEPLPGAWFQLRNGTTVVATAQSDLNGIVTFQKVKRGTYIMTETSAPAGYTRDTAVYNVSVTAAGATIRSAADGSTVTRIINTSSTRHKVILKKVSAVYAPLENAVFTLYRQDMTVLGSGLTSGDDGAFYIGELPLGIYYIKETAAPAGYNLPAADRVFKIEVTAEGVTCLGLVPTPAG